MCYGDYYMSDFYTHDERVKMKLEYDRKQNYFKWFKKKPYEVFKDYFKVLNK